MTVPSQTSRDSQAGNGVTLAFTVPFRILDQTHIRVLLTVAGTTTEQVLTTNYTVSHVGEASTTVTFLVAPVNGSTITFLRNVPITQETDYVPNDPFPAESHERALDKLTMIAGQLDEIGGEDGRTIKIPAQVTGVSTTLPVPVPLGVWAWDATATAPRYLSPADIATTVAYADWRVDTFTASAAQTDFTLTSDPGSVGNLDVSIDGVTQVNGVDFTYSGTTLTFAVAMAGGEKVLARYGQALPTGITNASAVGFLQAGTGAVERTAQEKMRDRVSVKDFGAVGDGVTDDTAAIQATIDYAASITGASVYLPRGVYRTTSTLTLSAVGATLVGDGSARISAAQESAGSVGVVGVAGRTGASRIYADFTSGAVIRLNNQGQVVQTLVVDASPTRKAAALSDNYGIHIEALDIVNTSTNGFFLNSVKVINQPSHGIVAVSGVACSRMEMPDVSYCHGHGIMITGGSFTGRTNRIRPGQVQINNGRVMRTGGHALLIGGSEVDSNDVPYRCEINNFEAFYNLITPSIAMDPANPCNGYISGENHTIDACAFDGRSQYPTISDTHSALFLQGRVIHVRNFRAIDAAPYCIYIEDHPITVSGVGTQNVHIEGLLISNSFRGVGYFNPAVFVDTACRDVRVWSGRVSSLVTNLSSRGNTDYDEYSDGLRRTNVPTTFDNITASRVTADRINADVVRTQDEFTMPSESAGYFQFASGARGILHISGNTVAAKAAVVHFRCGDASAHATVLSSSAGVVGQTGTLSGTTGVAGNLTIAADTASNRLYIENRTAGSRVYTVLFGPVNGATQSVGAFT